MTRFASTSAARSSARPSRASTAKANASACRSSRWHSKSRRPKKRPRMRLPSAAASRKRPASSTARRGKPCRRRPKSQSQTWRSTRSARAPPLPP
ncbi:hypothetical protein D7S70_08110 [Ralstonia pickettii]|nr:hypothetical protein [Ralstonia pickettii]MBB0097011.1 hypothetical protein [Ralstonia pickettii]MBB0107019.1 hypothetical protein [Ralstonia pickettii]MBB0127784.1 hypothetical protein [Ralstonia pickettii]MBB0160719.1 hypothetical protein [Ralstonia pickettii]